MSQLQNTLFTRKLIAGESLTITNDDGIRKFAIKVVSGTADLTGTKSVGGLASNTIQLAEGESFSAGTQSQMCCFTLDNITGVVNVSAASE